MTTTAPTLASTTIPGQAVPVERMPGHWLLARLGKRVLRPGGRELTEQLLESINIHTSDDLVELAPGLGATTELLLAANPASYVGVDRDPVSAKRVAALASGPNRTVIQSSAAKTGLDDQSADVVFGEAYLTMQPIKQKKLILDELARVIRPGGRLGIHEVCITPDGLDAETCAQLRGALTESIKVHVSPLHASGWIELLDEAGFEVRDRHHVPLHLLEPRRLVADEGLVGAARFATNVLRQPDARKRVVAMRAAMSRNGGHLEAIGLVAVRRST